jgi:hypothetical protein
MRVIILKINLSLANEILELCQYSSTTVKRDGGNVSKKVH